MTEHLDVVAAYIVGDDESELGKTKAELAYALMCLDREIAICAETDAKNAALVKALEEIRGAAHKGSLTPAERLQDIRIILGRVGGGKLP